VDNTPSPGYRGEHGISFFLESHCLRMLFDTGQSGDALLANAAAAGIDLGWLGMIALSHGHYDHTGGLMKALGRSGIVRLLAHADAFDKKVKIAEGREKDIGIPFSARELWHHCDVTLKSTPTMICDCIFTTGEVPRVTAFEKPDGRLLVEHKGVLSVDPVRDDQSLVVRSGEDLMLICGCCHSGVVNTMELVKTQLGRYPSVIAGGLHLENADDSRIKATVDAFRSAGVRKLVPGHCSGKKIGEAAAAAGIEVVPLHAGMRLL
jgi:7,8-dihydropterin-6-yl-methyl-4-(beta-D-ribofuranosyl)aminobenzene 5'-phosphate synthase